MLHNSLKLKSEAQQGLGKYDSQREEERERENEIYVKNLCTDVL